MFYRDFKIKNYVNLSKICNSAKIGKYAIPQFNTNNLEWTKVILLSCQEERSPVIIGASESAINYMGGYNVVVGLVISLIKDLNITVPVVLHLDHGSTIENCIMAINSGFTSVMLDASRFPIDDNCNMIKEVIKHAKKHNVSVEAEVGLVGGEEDGHYNKDLRYAKYKNVLKISKTGIDVLAAAYGSVHGHYVGVPKIAYDKIEKASKGTNLPIVLHGGSGLSDDIIKKSIRCGISKINLNTEFQEAFTDAVALYFQEKLHLHGKGYDPRKIIQFGIDNLKKVIISKIHLFGANNKC